MNTSILPTTTAASRADYLTNNEAAASDYAMAGVKALKIGDSGSFGVNFLAKSHIFDISWWLIPSSKTSSKT